MPSPRSLRPIILPSARHLPPILPCPVIHQHHHRRTTATLHPSIKSQNRVFLVSSAIAATFGAGLWLRPKRSANATVDESRQMGLATYAAIMENYTLPLLYSAIHEYLGCQNLKCEQLSLSELKSGGAPDNVATPYPDLQMYQYLDADATSENVKGNVVGFWMASRGREETELLFLLREFLIDFDSKGLLKREGMAVCLVSCNGDDSIWVYGEGRKGPELTVLWKGRLRRANLGT